MRIGCTVAACLALTWSTFADAHRTGDHLPQRLLDEVLDGNLLERSAPIMVVLATTSTPQPTLANSTSAPNTTTPVITPPTNSTTPTPTNATTSAPTASSSTPTPSTTTNTTTLPPVDPTTLSPNATTIAPSTPTPSNGTASPTPAPTTAPPTPTPSNATATPTPEPTTVPPAPTTLVVPNTTTAPDPTGAPNATTTMPPVVTVEPSPTLTPFVTNSTDPTTKPVATFPVVTDLPIVTKKVDENATGTTLEILNGTKAPLTTVATDGLLDLTPSPSKAKAPGAPTGDAESPDAPAPTRRISAPRTNMPVGGAVALDIDPTQASVAGADTSANKTNRYVFNAVVGLTLVLLVFFHYLALDPSFVAPESTGEAIAAPNSWELPSFATFMQLVAVASCANVDAPHAIFASFTDSFSWVNFVVRGSAYTSKKASVSAVTLLSDTHRALASAQESATSYDAFGFFQFALRMNVFEFDLFVRAWTFFLIVLACLLVLVVVPAVVSECMGRRTPFTQSDSGSYSYHMKGASPRLQGYGVWFISMAVLPLTTVSMYEFMRDSTSTAGFGSASGVVALLALILVGGGVLAAGFTVYRHTEVELSKYRTKITFGVLYRNLKFEFRAFFAVSLLVQYATGVLLAGVVTPSTQLILLMALHAAYAVLVVAVRPFETTLQLVFTVVFELVVVAVFGIAYGMARTTDTDSKRSLAYVVVILVCVVIVVMFVRSLYKLWTYVTGAGSNAAYSVYSQGAIPALQSIGESNRGIDSIDTVSLNSGGDHYMTLNTPTNTVKLVETSAKQYD